MKNAYSEDNLVEQPSIELLQSLWGEENFINAFSDEGDRELQRENQGEVVLIQFLKIALVALNPDVSTEALNLAIDEIIRDRSTMSLVGANEEVWKLLRDGVKVETQDEEGAMQEETVKVIDWNKPEENHFMVVSQMWITGELHKRRPDLIGFVNGIPLVLFELKSSQKNLRNAYKQNIRDYRDTIPQLFWYNGFIVLSNGIESKVGTLTSEYEHYHEWKKINEEEEEGVVSLETVIRGTCPKERLLDLVENFTLYKSAKGSKQKIIARYHQYLGVNKAVERAKNRDEYDGKLGVFWHTQGSGKSFSMVFFSQKVLRKLHGNFTFVVITDRSELDRQIYKDFAYCDAAKEKEIQATSISHLRDLLTEDHRHIFTLIHKFGVKLGEKQPVLSERSDIIVMADEAHRTQYDVLAMNMRIALPNASFIGFTGTPLIAGEEEETRQTFGDYVSVYNFAQSVEDGTTMPLYYENRVPKLENVNPSIEKDLEEIMEFYELSEDAEERLEEEFSTFYHLITRDDRLEKVAEDIVEHFIGQGQDGKGMVVSIDKKTTVTMYIKVKKHLDRYLTKLRLKHANAKSQQEAEDTLEKINRCEMLDMAVVVSQGQNEIDDFKQHDIDFRPIRERMMNEDLETKFKDDNDNLRMVFVCAMWITGFDVPSLTTLYLDKPLKNHTLMQTIARVNRVHPGKTNGLIVDYIGVFRNLQKALSVYAVQDGQDVDDIIKEKQELIDELDRNVEETKKYLSKFDLDIQEIIEAEKLTKLKLLGKFSDVLLQSDEVKKEYSQLAAACKKYFKAVLPSIEAEAYREEVTVFSVLADRVKDISEEEGADLEQIKKDLEGLLDDSIKTGKYKIYDVPKLKDLSSIDFEALREYFEGNQKHVAIERLKNVLQREIEGMVQRNQTRQKFLDRLNGLLQDYNAGTKTKEELFDQLVELARDVGEEQHRAVKEELTEEELAIFDLLRKDNLSPDEEVKVKKVSQELLERIRDKITLDWRKKQAAKADVKVTIQQTLYRSLPEPTYTEEDCKNKTIAVFQHIFDKYLDSQTHAFV